MQRAPWILSLSSEIGSYISFQSRTRSSTGFRFGPSRAYFMKPFGSPMATQLGIFLSMYRACFALPLFEDALIVDRHDLHKFWQRGIERIQHMLGLAAARIHAVFGEK